MGLLTETSLEEIENRSLRHDCCSAIALLDILGAVWNCFLINYPISRRGRSERSYIYNQLVSGSWPADDQCWHRSALTTHGWSCDHCSVQSVLETASSQYHLHWGRVNQQDNFINLCFTFYYNLFIFASLTEIISSTSQSDAGSEWLMLSYVWLMRVSGHLTEQWEITGDMGRPVTQHSEKPCDIIWHTSFMISHWVSEPVMITLSDNMQLSEIQWSETTFLNLTMMEKKYWSSKWGVIVSCYSGPSPGWRECLHGIIRTRRKHLT